MADYTRPLRQYVEHGIQILVECRQCGHTATFSPFGLAARWGKDIDPAFLPFRCCAPREADGRRCRSRSVRVSPVWPEQVVDLNGKK
ncbi:MAG TPA: hypothetical protein VGV37_01915 [Aliidongia sp.]|uniref:hypothetical protein n=1 Tax=Aliidongia sp. TaxID=1914230 RepID=UPI002DDCD249|nr:hypothetical protein [Aliidongia sp.]HEV2673267.1 hypothetical protein [Aliidongia sp.]